MSNNNSLLINKFTLFVEIQISKDQRDNPVKKDNLISVLLNEKSAEIVQREMTTNFRVMKNSGISNWTE